MLYPTSASAHGHAPASILDAAIADAAEPDSLRPRAPRLLVDAGYMLYAAGLLACVAPRAAIALAKQSLRPITADRSHALLGSPA